LNHCWPLSTLPDALAALLQKPFPPLPAAANLPDWLEVTALRHGYEAEPCEFTPDICAPALIQLAPDRFLAVIKGGRRLRVIAPDLSVHSVSNPQNSNLARRQHSSPGLAQLLNEAGLSPKRQQRVINVLLNSQGADNPIENCWRFRPKNAPGAGIWSGITGMLTAHLTQYLLWLASWAVLGSLSFSGHLDRGWLLAWALLLATLLPFRLLATWLQGVFAIRLGGFLKARLLEGALRLEPEEVRAKGIGSFLTQALEAESVETLAISGGVAGLLALMELLPAMFILGKLAWALACFGALASLAAWRFFRSFQQWNTQRLELTSKLVESMAGHRTRQAQQNPNDWHVAEERSLLQYLKDSQQIDRTGCWLIAAVPRSWLLVGLAAMAPSIVAGGLLNSQAAILLGGVLLAYSALQRLVASFTDVAAAAVAWQKIQPLFQAAARPEQPGQAVETSGTAPVAEGQRVAFRYPGQPKPALEDCAFAIKRGERILLEGPSGGGKTTLASLLAGLRKPEFGLLLINGLDRHTLGDRGWRKRVAVAPQFHENHILTGTLALNLLMGRPGPLTAADFREAEEICRELALGQLLERMPGGLLQMVGEGGWQLSHGERSRLFLARALLQKSDMVILDETFAALDPESLRASMECAFRRAGTLLVIAHP
jgi:ATP-binding cassette subfamily B protein